MQSDNEAQIEYVTEFSGPSSSASSSTGACSEPTRKKKKRVHALMEVIVSI